MSQMIARSLMRIFLCLSVAVMVSCSSPNSNSLISPDTGKHPANWMTGSPIVHGVTAETGLNAFKACQVCHGQDFRGGMAKVSCYTGTANGCHNGPGVNHPAPGWVVPLSSTSTLPFHKTEASSDPSVCTKCHGADFLGGVVGVACIDCHMDGPTSVHITSSTSWSVPDHGDYVGANGSNHGTSKCANNFCHGDPFRETAVQYDPNTNTNLSGPNCNNSGGAIPGNFACHPWPH